MTYYDPSQATINDRLQRGFLSDTAEGKRQILAATRQVGAMVLRPTVEAFTYATQPKCGKCGFTDGCVDDDHGAVCTTWLPVLGGFICAGCVNSAIHGPQSDDEEIQF